MKQMARIVQAGAVVGNAEFLDALDRTSVLDGDGRIIGEGLQQNLVAGIELHVNIHQSG